MDTKDNKMEEKDPQEETAARDLLPDRDILMMEKPVPSNKAVGYKPADKKLLRNIVIIVLFLIVVLVVLWALVGSGGSQGPGKGSDTPKELDISSPK